MLQNPVIHWASKDPDGVLAELDRADCECERGLRHFFRRAWPVIEPGSAYIHGWHLDAIADHLEAVTSGDITRLLINIPPGTMKSLAVGVLWPAWEWGPKHLPHHRYVGVSHEQGLAIRDNRRMRQIIASQWFQARWPLALSGDQNQKLKFENAATGFRAAVSATSLTGHRGDRVIYDDPHSVEGALSDQQRETVLRIFAETLTTRLNVPESSAIVVVMQRLHERDLSGHILEQDLGYEHLCLPMEFEEERRCRTSIGFEDPRIEGELLFPERFPREVVEGGRQAMGTLATAGQFQQRPTPRGGGMFPVDRFVILEHQPLLSEIKASVRYWDKAGTEAAQTGAGSAYTAGVLLHQMRDGRFVVGDVRRGQWSALDRERVIRQTAQADGKRVTVWVEQEPGSGGKESAEATIRNLAGYTCKADRPSGDKTLRAEPYAAQVEAGNVGLVRADWNLPFMDEHRSFPVGRTKDMVDATAAGFNILTLVPTSHASAGRIRGLM